ncbi:polysaccharide lyase family 7 protein [Piscinibacter sakaiensis]|uniref:polysaccharide lyase family 7 protein n=1 Tax=Piscinibacter sakaiensis TaxID=1547922 RepID=UPI003AAC2431
MIPKHMALAVAALMASASFVTLADTPVHPADLLGGLKHWHLTLPTSQDRKAFPADQIDQPQLATYSSEWFKLNDKKNAVVFTTNVGGATTSAGTAFARTELRERDAQGEKAAWECLTAERSMTFRQRILKTPTHKPQMSVGQIHDAKNDNLELYYNGPKKNTNGTTDVGKMLAKFNGESSSKAPVLDDEYQIGDMMVVKISTKAGVMTVDYKNERTGKTSTASKPFENVVGGCYFKAGNYPQACTKTNVYGVENPNCSKKSYKPEMFETDPNATAVLEIYSLNID